MRNAALIALVTLAASAVLAPARSQHGHAKGGHASAKKPATCPVTKAKITDSSNAPHLTVNRDTVFVCCPSCIPKLKQAPAKYLKQVKGPVNGKTFNVTAKTPGIVKGGALYLFASKETHAHGLQYLSGDGHGHGPHTGKPAKPSKPHGEHSSNHSGGHDAAPGKAALVQVGQPDFSVTDLSGATLTLSDLRKKTPSGAVTLTYWCSFCHSCRHLEKRLDEFARQQRDKAAVVLIDASAGETPEGVSAFAMKTGLTLPILLDEGGKSVDLFGIKTTTTTLVIDVKGILRYRGQFKQGEKEPAVAALQAVLTGKEVLQKETAQRG